jgi:hypothetical protein
MFEILRRRAGAMFFAAALFGAGCGGGGGGKNTPTETDLLGGAGDFEGEAHQAMWFVQAGVEVNADLWSACDSGSTCAKIELSDYGANSYSSQLAYWDATLDPATFRTVSLTQGKFYTIKFWAQAVNPDDAAGVTHPVTAWLQQTDDAGNYGVVECEVPAEGTECTATGFEFAGATGTESKVVLNFGPQDTNGGTTFYVDNLQILEGEPPPPPAGTDMLGGAGSFSDEAAQAKWRFEYHDETNEFPGDANSQLEYVTEDGFDGPCAKISGTVGTTNYYTQFGWQNEDASGWGRIALEEGQTYQIRVRTKVTGAGDETVVGSVWMQDGSSATAPPNGWSGAAADVLFSATAEDRVLGVFTSTAAELEMKFNFGGTDREGMTFFVDNIQLIKVDQ